MRKISIQYYKSPVGELILGAIDEKLCLCDWRYRKMRDQIDKRITQGLNSTFEENTTNVLDHTVRELDEYFAKNRKAFSIPLLLVGSDFQKMVWNELLNIPFGETESYLSLSEKLENPKAIRAVAGANGANAISIIVPCHRIIGSDGSLVGYAGGLSAKEKLLKLEGRLDSHQLDLFQ